MGMPSPTVARSDSARGGQPTGTTAFATGSRMSETASPSRKICASWPASAGAFACRNGNAALVGSSEPRALFTRTFMAGLSRAAPELASGQPGPLGQGRELQPGHARVGVVEPDAGGGEAAVGAGDDVLTPHEAGEADDALGDQLGVLHQVGGVADHARDEDHPVGRAELLEHVVLVLVARVG